MTVRGILMRTLYAIFCAAVIVVAGIVAVERSIPLSNTSRTKFDVIIVLGYPAASDGSIAADTRERVLEGVREYRAGVAPRLIFTGAAAHNKFVEAEVMAKFAEAQGVPAADIIEEPRALNTIQNAWYSVAIMRAHGWHSTEVVTAPYHIPRSALIFSHFPIEWRMKAGNWPPEYDYQLRAAVSFGEALRSDKLRIFGFPKTPFLPAKK